MKKLAGNITDFEQLVQGNYFYVDKTEYLWKLIRLAGESYLLHRPSQMGISLLLSTLKAIFRERRSCSGDWQFMISLMIGRHIE